MARTHTYNEGGSDERSAWLAKLRRIVSRNTSDFDPALSRRKLAQSLIRWGLGRSARTATRTGGLGRR